MILNLQHACADSKASRPLMEYVLLTPSNCYATNGHIAAVVPTSEMFDWEFVESIEDRRLLIPSSVWAKMAHKDVLNVTLSDGLVESSISIIHKKDGLSSHQIKTEKEVGKFPDVDSIFWDLSEASPLESIGVNPSLLLDLSKAMTPSGEKARGLKMYFKGVSKGVRVSTYSDSGAFGLIMPLYNANT